MKYNLNGGNPSQSPDVDARGSARRTGDSHEPACHRFITPTPPRKRMSLQEWVKHQAETPVDPAPPKPFSIKSRRRGNKVIFTPPPMKGGVAVPPEEKRGAISKLTPATMRRLKRDLAEVVAATEAYTFCFTYPDEFPTAKVAREHFNKFTRWCSRKKWKPFGAHYKREPQKRGATHFHILLYCNDGGELARECALAWLRKWCAISSEGQSDEEKAKQLEWHLHEKNFEKMRGDSFFDYLGKYIGKDGGDMPDGYVNEGGGKWWGKINKAVIPYAEEVDETPQVDLAMQWQIMRVIRKVRQQRMQGALDALHPVAENPRLQRDELAKAIYRMRKDEYGETPKSARKMATRWMFRNDGARKLVNAPIKVGQSSRWDCKKKITKLPKHGKVTLLGRPIPITEAIERMITCAVDHAARKRIFADGYQPT